MKISDQALGAIMMALQNSLMNQTDIVPVLKSFDLQLNEKEELIVINPPIVRADEEDLDVGFEEETVNTVGSD